MKPNAIKGITQFLSSDLLKEEIENLPHEFQEIIDMILDTPYGNDLETRRKLLRHKHIINNFARALESYTEDEIQQSCREYHLMHSN